MFIISALETNLEKIAKSYRPKTLRLIFLLNNYFYVLKLMKADEMVRLVGGGFVAKYERAIVKNKNDYQSERWLFSSSICACFDTALAVGILSSHFLISPMHRKSSAAATARQ